MYDLFYFQRLLGNDFAFIEHTTVEDSDFEIYKKNYKGVKENLTDDSIKNFFVKVKPHPKDMVVLLYINNYSLIDRGLLFMKSVSDSPPSGVKIFSIDNDGNLKTDGVEVNEFINNSPISFIITPTPSPPKKAGGRRKTIKRRQK